jgi:sigma-B regulation protein RsbU (phosphoserine phosphatase)
MEGELKIAHRIQAGLLPDRFPDVPGTHWTPGTIPAREVGGDYYDFLPNAVAVSPWRSAGRHGPGVPAALVMSKIRSLLRGQAERGTPDEVLNG